jgi:hypothetical protein
MNRWLKQAACVLLLLGLIPLTAAAQKKAKAAEKAQNVTLRGRVVCLTEELAQPFQVTPDCELRGHNYSLKTADGKLYQFLPTDTAAAIYDDAQFRERQLQVTARLFPRTSFIEVIKLQSFRAGKLYDLYYY